MQSSKAIVIGAGIVGLATARALSLKGYAVTVIERTDKAVGASIRNFGMLWPIGQAAGKLYQRALRSKQIWKEVADSTGLPYLENGSLHTAYHADEWQVLQELEAEFVKENRPVCLMDKNEMQQKFSGLQTEGLLGGLFSSTEMIVDPREAIATAAAYLEEFLGVQFIWGKQVNEVSSHSVRSGKEIYKADMVCICNGADFETLFPEIFNELPITKCKLQMLRFVSDQPSFTIGTSVCGGLSLIHYKSFTAAPSLPKLKQRYEMEMAEYLNAGIHVMVSQNNRGELTVGDSHEYAKTFEPFDSAHINQLILDYLQTFMHSKQWQLTQTWNGVYPKMTNGETDLFLQPEPGVYIVNGLGGAGMTLSFGFAEEVVSSL